MTIDWSLAPSTAVASLPVAFDLLRKGYADATVEYAPRRISADEADFEKFRQALEKRIYEKNVSDSELISGYWCRVNG